jgi:membrane-associated phospholipid phosphatase
MLKEKIQLKNSPLLLILFFLGSLFLVLILSKRFFFVPKILMILLVLIAVAVLGKLKIFLEDWFVFIGFIYLFDSLRGSIYIATCKFGLPVYTLYVIKLEKFLFGGIPPVVLQNWLLHPLSPTNFSWFEKFITVAHGSHFVAFLLVGFIIWLYKSNNFRFFKISFYLVIFLGLLGYFAFPTVAPWMAANVFGLFPRIIRFIAIIYNLAIPDLSSGFDTNPIAAMPSLHAAFPVLCSLILWRIYRWKASVFYLYALLMLFVIVYTGEHYIVDVLAGVVLAILCYFVAHKLTGMKSKTEKKHPVSENRQESGLGKMYRAMIGGILILFIGMVIGSYNRNQFLKHAIAYNLYVPKYIDFFKHEQDFRSNYQVQFYLGSHYLFKGEYQKAIPHYERSLALSKTDQEKERAEAGLNKCKELVGQKN